MITRKLLAALVGLSLVAGSVGTASAQNTTATASPSVSPSDTVAPTSAVKSDLPKKAPSHKHHARMTSKTHRKHVSVRTTKHVASKQFIGEKAVGSRSVLKVAMHAKKRLRLSRLVKHGTTKHV